jgi:hypothetical protein
MHDVSLGDKFAKDRLLQTHPLPIVSRVSARRVLMTYTGDTLYPPLQSQPLGPNGRMSTATIIRLPSTRLREHHHQGGGRKPNTRSSGVTKSTPKKGGKKKKKKQRGEPRATEQWCPACVRRLLQQGPGHLCCDIPQKPGDRQPSCRPLLAPRAHLQV